MPKVDLNYSSKYLTCILDTLGAQRESRAILASMNKETKLVTAVLWSCCVLEWRNLLTRYIFMLPELQASLAT